MLAMLFASMGLFGVFVYSALIFVVAAVVAGLVLPKGNLRALSGPAPDGTVS